MALSLIVTQWICIVYIAHTEAMGHSGLRASAPATPASSFLEPFGLELNIEDHDLHHRNGWRKSFKYASSFLPRLRYIHSVLILEPLTPLAYSYGKQTKMWDTLFGTARPRIECVPENMGWK